MKVALCLYGQPRYLDFGYESIKKHIIDRYSPDVFFHTWDSKDEYQVSPWRNIRCVPVLEDITRVAQLYKPVRYKIEQTKTFEANKESLGYKKAKSSIKKNVPNILSQIHSRQAVRDLFVSYTVENNLTYDFVIMCRFDICITSLPDYVPGKILFSNDYFERPLVFNDNLIILGQTEFINLFNIQNDFDMHTSKGVLPNMEELLTASILHYSIDGKCQKTPEMAFNLVQH